MTDVSKGSSGKGLLERELNGASFLGLEHFGHMVLVVIVPGLLLSAITTALGLWFGVGLMPSVLDVMLTSYGSSQLASVAAIGITAGLAVLVPLMLLLSRRTRAEWNKRPAFAGRLAYKLPLYAALAAIGGFLVWYKIQLVTVLLNTFVYIGVPDAPYGYLYSSTFLPALLGIILYGIAGWYVFKLAKGKDYGKVFDVTLATFGVIMAFALFITAITKMHEPGVTPRGIEPWPSPAYDLPSYDSKKLY